MINIYQFINKLRKIKLNSRVELNFDESTILICDCLPKIVNYTQQSVLQLILL